MSDIKGTISMLTVERDDENKITVRENPVYATINTLADTTTAEWSADNDCVFIKIGALTVVISLAQARGLARQIGDASEAAELQNPGLKS